MSRVGSPKYTTLTLEEKNNLLDLAEKGVPVKNLCQQFGVGKSLVYKVIHQRNEVRKEWLEGGSNASRKRKRDPYHKELNDLVWQWFVTCRAKNEAVSGPLLQAKAKEIALSLGEQDFKASNGWLDSFKKRHKISCKQFFGNGKDSLENNRKIKLHHITGSYDSRDIYICDETGLFYRAFPTRTLITNKEKCADGKMSKERLTVLLCCNMEGHFEIPVVVGESQQQERCINTNTNCLPVTWYSSSKSWMTANIMEDWLQKFNNNMGKENRSVLLLLSNAMCHPRIELTNVKLCWFPSISANIAESFQNHVIYYMKLNYRIMLMKSVIANMDSTISLTELATSVTVSDAVNWIACSCQRITSTTVKRCFDEAGFTVNSVPQIPQESKEDYDITLKKLLEEAKIVDIEAKEYVVIDDELCTDDGMAFGIVVNSHDHHTEGINEDSITIEDIPHGIPMQSYKDTLNHIKYVRNFILKTNDKELLNKVNDLLNHTEQWIVETKRQGI